MIKIEKQMIFGEHYARIYKDGQFYTLLVAKDPGKLDTMVNETLAKMLNEPKIAIDGTVFKSGSYEESGIDTAEHAESESQCDNIPDDAPSQLAIESAYNEGRADGLAEGFNLFLNFLKGGDE